MTADSFMNKKILLLKLVGLTISLSLSPISAGLAQTGPKGDFKIEEETKGTPEQDDRDVIAFVISTSDPNSKVQFNQHPETTHVTYYISPNGRWIYGSANYGSRMEGGKLFKRAEGLKFAPVNNENLDDSVWKFFGREEKLSTKKIPHFVSGEGMIDFVASSPDSGRLLLSLRGGDFDGKRDKGIDAWYVYFNTKTGSFALTNRLRAPNKDAWKRRAEYYSDSDEPTKPSEAFQELTDAEPLTQSGDKPTRKN